MSAYAQPAADGPADAPGTRAAIDRMVDWELAVRTAGRMAGPGPEVAPDQAREAVAELRLAARRAVPHVAEVTGLSVPSGDSVVVVDRPTWARVNVAGFRQVLSPVAEQALGRRERPVPAAVTAIGSRVTGAEVGSLLGVLSTRVLGQYDAFGPGRRLLLVAPNVVAIERELDVPPADFRLWVCLHEETHRVQFGAHPWLADHLLEQVRGLVGGLMAEPGQVLERLAGVLRGLPDLIRGTGSGAPLLDAVQTPAERAKLASITAVMSLLEGHADVVMDDVGPQVVPSVATIRARFSARRAGRGTVDQLLRRLLGLDAKARQYTDGARFVRAVQGAVGVPGFNAVWAGPHALPTPAEIADPQLWLRRVHDG